MQKIFAEAVAQGEEKIRVAEAKIKQIRDEADKTEYLVGMRGSVLLECLSSIRSFAKAQINSTLIWQPLIDLLECFLALCKNSVDLLSGENADKETVLVGVNRLCFHVGFMNTAISFLTEGTMDPEFYNAVVSSARAKKFLAN